MGNLCSNFAEKYVKRNRCLFLIRKITWPCVYIVITVMTMFLVHKMWEGFLSNPTVITLESRAYPVNEIPYPAISLCDINKISKRQAEILATSLSNATGENYTKMMESIKFLGYLNYDSDSDSSRRPDVEYFQDVLDNSGYEIQNLMMQLATPCDELLVSCSWKGVKVNCTSIFRLHLTYDGFCCTFNYIKRTPQWSSPPEKPLSGESGFRNGLSVIVNNNPEDYYVTSLNSLGVKILVFLPSDYPDESSGSLTANVANIGSENFLEVIPTTVRAVRDVASYAIDKRECLFEEEQRTQFGFYSQSDCFVDCKIKSMLTLCQCVPFVIPWRNDETICTLRDLPCLSKHKDKWLALAPKNVIENIPFKEQQSALRCDKTCWPSCQSTLYDVIASSCRLHSSVSPNKSVIHIFYRNRYHNLYRQDVVYYWYEILSNFGGIFGVTVGVSIISIIELLIYCIKFVESKLYMHE